MCHNTQMWAVQSCVIITHVWAVQSCVIITQSRTVMCHNTQLWAIQSCVIITQLWAVQSCVIITQSRTVTCHNHTAVSHTVTCHNHTAVSHTVMCFLQNADVGCYVQQITMNKKLVNTAGRDVIMVTEFDLHRGRETAEYVCVSWWKEHCQCLCQWPAVDAHGTYTTFVLLQTDLLQVWCVPEAACTPAAHLPTKHQ